MNLFNPSKQINEINSNMTTTDKCETMESLACQQTVDKLKGKLKPTLTLNDIQVMEGAYKITETKQSTERNDEEVINRIDDLALVINEAKEDTIENKNKNVTHIRMRKNRKRKLEATWNLNEEVGIDDADKKAKEPCHFTERECAEVILKTKKSFDELTNSNKSPVYHSNQINNSHMSSSEENNSEQVENEACINAPSRDNGRRKWKHAGKLNNITGSVDANKRAKQSPHSKVKNDAESESQTADSMEEPIRTEIKAINQSNPVNATERNIANFKEDKTVEKEIHLYCRGGGKMPRANPVNATERNIANFKEDKTVEKEIHLYCRGGGKMAVISTWKLNDNLYTENANERAKQYPHSIKRKNVEEIIKTKETIDDLINKDMNQGKHSKLVGATNKCIPKVKQSEVVEIVANLRCRDKGKRALKPTWKLNDALGIADANKKVRQACNALEKNNAGKIVNNKDSIDCTLSLSSLEQTRTDVENQNQTLSVKINTDNKKKDELSRRRRQQLARNLSRSKTLYCLTPGNFRNMYYLVKKKSKKAVRNKTSLKKRETVVNDKISEASSVSVNLEDYPNSYCIEDYTNLARDARHKSVEENQCQRFLCKICNSYRTLLIENLRQHIQLHINGKLNCKTCDFIADSPYNLRCHMNKNHAESRGSVICELCGIFTGGSNSYKAHANKVHGIAAFECNYCELAFHKRGALKEHMLTVHKSCVYQCDQCKSVLKSQIGLEDHLKKCVVKVYTCKHCSHVAKSKHFLKMHVRYKHSKDSTHKCSICTFSSISKQNLTNHMNAHLGIHQYFCDLCEFSCVKKYQLESHQRTHSGEKKFKCDKCCYAAAWNVQLKTHMKAHDSVTQCICKVCGIVLKDKRCLKLHKKKEHDNASVVSEK